MLDNYLENEEIQEKEVEYDEIASDEDENYLALQGNFNDDYDGEEDDENEGASNDIGSKNETRSSGSSLLKSKRKNK